MKSAAFNLAFKVHRNDLSFPEGLLKAYEEDAHHDFIEALNSLAGEEKFDSNSIEQLVEEARANLDGETTRPQIDVGALKEEIEKLETSKKEHQNGIQTLKNQNASYKTTIVPGLNSILMGMVGLIIAIIMFLLGLAIVAIIVMGITVGVGIMLWMQDTEALQKQKDNIARKVERNLYEIQQIQSKLEQIENHLSEKQQLLASVEQHADPASNFQEQH